MDDYNIADLKEMAPEASIAKILLLGEYDYNRPNVIPDPYFVSYVIIRYWNCLILKFIVGSWYIWI